MDNKTTKEIVYLYESWGDLRKKFDVQVLPKRNCSLELFKRDIYDMARNVDIRRPIAVKSHRRAIGPIIVLIKRLMMRLAKPVIHVCFQRQLVMNDHTVNIAQRVLSLEDRLIELEKEVARLETQTKKN